MKTDYLIEKYLKGFNFKHPMTGEIYIEIFEDPSTKEMREVMEYDSVRFFADKRIKKVFAWTPRLIHTQALRKIPKIKSFKTPFESDSFIAGVAKFQSGSFVMVEGADLLGLVNNQNLFKRGVNWDIDGWKWADRYIKITPYLEYISK